MVTNNQDPRAQGLTFRNGNKEVTALLKVCSEVAQEYSQEQHCQQVEN